MQFPQEQMPEGTVDGQYADCAWDPNMNQVPDQNTMPQGNF